LERGSRLRIDLYVEENLRDEPEEQDVQDFINYVISELMEAPEKKKGAKEPSLSPMIVPGKSSKGASKGTKTPAPSDKSSPQGKGKGKGQGKEQKKSIEKGKGDKPKGKCYFFGTSNGCKKGAECPYSHDGDKAQPSTSPPSSPPAASSLNASSPQNAGDQEAKLKDAVKAAMIQVLKEAQQAQLKSFDVGEVRELARLMGFSNEETEYVLADSGATHTLVHQGSEPEPPGTRDIMVTLAGGGQQAARITPSGEVLIPGGGEELFSIGESHQHPGRSRA
jgi:hypothetical protein